MQGLASAILAHDGTYARFVQVTHRSWVAVIDHQHQKPAKPRRESLIDFRSAPVEGLPDGKTRQQPP
jgi:hypothetical protein